MLDANRSQGGSHLVRSMSVRARSRRRRCLYQLGYECLECRQLLALLTFEGIPDWIENGPTRINDPPGGNLGMAEAIAVHPNNPDVMYVASGNGGVWRTDNARYSLLDNADNDGDGSVDEPDEIPVWTPTMEQWPNLSMGAIAFDPLDGSSATLYAGNGRFSSYYAGGPRLGLMKTVDSGTTWTELGRSTFGNLSIEAIVPTRITSGDQQTILVATNAGIYRSTNTGSTWTKASGAAGSNLPNGVTTALVSDPSDDNRFWTAIPGQGVYRSTDGGANGLPSTAACKS